MRTLLTPNIPHTLLYSIAFLGRNRVVWRWKRDSCGIHPSKQFLQFGASVFIIIIIRFFLTFELSYCLRSWVQMQHVRLTAALFGIPLKLCFCGLFSPVNAETPSSLYRSFPPGPPTPGPETPQCLPWMASLRGVFKKVCLLLFTFKIRCRMYSLIFDTTNTMVCSDTLSAQTYLVRHFNGGAK